MKNIGLLVLLALSFFTQAWAEPMNLGLYKNELRAYHDKGAYENEIAQVLESAKKYIDERVRANKTLRHPKQLAIVYDIDETVLSNYPDMVTLNFGGTLDSITDAIAKGQDPALAPSLAFYNYAKSLGIDAYFVTGRPERIRDVTITNLHHAGYDNWKELYLRPNDFHPKASISEFKIKARKNIAQRGVVIIASIGDQESDLTGPYREKGFKLPNPYYYLP